MYFFEDAPVLLPPTDKAAPGPENVEEADRFIDAYYKIPDVKVRRDILSLLKAAGGAE
ncbi:MAG: hypothetical protein HQ512_02840 [Rhodospirillales bacterium]|nr:hypothetical protein [Rhodospirillales bacterium]